MLKTLNFNHEFDVRFCVCTAWQLPVAENEHIHQMISQQIPAGSGNSLCHVAATCHQVTGSTVVDRRPAILSKPFRSQPILSTPSRPLDTDGKTHIHHQRKLSHHALAVTSTMSTNSNVLS